jgi:hypothetical protein
MSSIGLLRCHSRQVIDGGSRRASSLRRATKKLLTAMGEEERRQNTIAIAPTDVDWFEFLSRELPTLEMNFWTPTPWNICRLEQADRFYFLLKGPYREIGGYGHFRYYENMAASAHETAHLQLGLTKQHSSKAGQVTPMRPTEGASTVPTLLLASRGSVTHSPFFLCTNRLRSTCRFIEDSLPNVLMVDAKQGKWNQGK